MNFFKTCILNLPCIAQVEAAALLAEKEVMNEVKPVNSLTTCPIACSTHHLRVC